MCTVFVELRRVKKNFLKKMELLHKKASRNKIMSYECILPVVSTLQAFYAISGAFVIQFEGDCDVCQEEKKRRKSAIYK